MAKRDIKTLKTGYDAFNTGDVEAVLAIFDARIQWYEPDAEGLPWAGRHSGAKAVAAEVFGPAVAAIQNLKVKADEFLSDGDTIVVTGAFSGKGKDGKNFKAPFAHIWKMRDGKAVRHQNHTDTATMVKAIGGGSARRRGYPRGG
jgi:ketosteroid isomerase-like protein